jgi:hypothetical protein
MTLEKRCTLNNRMPRWLPAGLVALALALALASALARQLTSDRAASTEVHSLEDRAAQVAQLWVWTDSPGPAASSLAVLSADCVLSPGLEGLAAALADQRCAGLDQELLSFPPTDPREGRALVALVGPERLMLAYQLHPLILSWYAGEPLEAMSQGELRLLALITARFLGTSDAASMDGSVASQQAVQGLERFRRAAVQACVDCEGQLTPLPLGAPVADLPPSVQGERSLRSASPDQEPTSELGRLVATVRGGGQASPQVWDQVGFCGMVALELARAERVESLPQLLEAAVDGPSALDRMAALYGAALLVDPAAWPPGPARERALAVGALDELYSDPR